MDIDGDKMQIIDTRYGDDLGDAIHYGLKLFEDPTREEDDDNWSLNGFVSAAMHSLPLDQLEAIMVNIRKSRSN